MTFRFIGKSLPRTEDLRLVRGLGRYTADLAPPDALRLYVLRSPHAAARIRTIDTGAAQSMPGVQLVLTGDDPELLFARQHPVQGQAQGAGRLAEFRAALPDAGA